MARISVLATAVLLALPFFFVAFPPSTDLPQHVAQIRLLGEALHGSAYTVQWLAPNNLVYAVLGALWLVLPPLAVGRIALCLLALAWAGATTWLAARRQRPPETAMLAAVLVFQPALYWGFLNFLIGWPIFAIWLATVESTTVTRPALRCAGLAGLALLLYASHILWLAVGLAWLVIATLMSRPPRREVVGRALAVVPAIALTAVWMPHLLASRSPFDVAPHWYTMPWARLWPPRLLESMFGRATVEAAVIGIVVLVWIALSSLRRSERADRTLLAAAALFGVISLAAPDKYMNTILFAERWAPCAIALLLLALPPPVVRPRLRWPLAAGLLAATSLATTFAWLTFEHEDLSGFRMAIAAAPAGGRVLGLDFVKESPHVPGYPFLQMAAYAQVARGGRLGFSFAEHGSSIVSLRQPSLPPWTPGLEWHAERVQRSDFRYFDVVLANGEEPIHQQLARLPELEPLTGPGRWRLYRVRRP